MRDILDPDALTDLLAATGDDPARGGELVDTFVADAGDQLTAMQRAVAADSADDLMRPAGALKDRAQTLGAVALAELCRQIEELARRGAVDEASARVALAEVAWGDAVDALEAAREAGWDAE